MKTFYIASMAAMMALPVMAEDTENSDKQYDSENGVVTIGADRMFQIESKDGNFSFKPYMMLQMTGNYNYYDDEGLDKAYNQDNVANSGFSFPYAVLGFTGKAFGKVTYNLSVNAAKSGGALLQQAWFDVKLSKGFAVKAGKFKTPFSHAYLTTLGETLMPQLPTSFTASVILPYSLNAVTPSVGTGFDIGVMVHGQISRHLGYEASSMVPVRRSILPQRLYQMTGIYRQCSMLDVLHGSQRVRCRLHRVTRNCCMRIDCLWLHRQALMWRARMRAPMTRATVWSLRGCTTAGMWVLRHI